MDWWHPKQMWLNLRLSLIVLASLALTAACGELAQPPIRELDEKPKFSQAESDRLFVYNSNRWAIEIYRERGMPGTPDAEIFIPNARKVLQAIVDECRLGQTVLFNHMHGVSELVIENEPSKESLDCVRKRERPGIRLREPLV